MTNKLKIIKKIYLPIILCLFFAVWSTLTIKNFSTQIINIGEKIEQQQLLSANLQQRELTIMTINSEFLKIGDFEKRLDQALPMVDNLFPFINAVENVSKKQALLGSVTLSPPIVLTAEQNGKASFKIPFTISLKQIDAQQLSIYLREFESLPYFAGIDSITMFSQSKNGWLDTADIKLIGKLYAKN